MFIYHDNDQLKKEVKKYMIDNNLLQKDIAEKMGVKPQQYINIIKKENLSFRDIKRIGDAAGFQLEVNFKPISDAADNH